MGGLFWLPVVFRIVGAGVAALLAFDLRLLEPLTRGVFFSARMLLNLLLAMMASYAAIAVS